MKTFLSTLEAINLKNLLYAAIGLIVLAVLAFTILFVLALLIPLAALAAIYLVAVRLPAKIEPTRLVGLDTDIELLYHGPEGNFYKLAHFGSDHVFGGNLEAANMATSTNSCIGVPVALDRFDRPCCSWLVRSHVKKARAKTAASAK